jgi:5-methyltetrahydrofolate corrinoid/iron sulfur protein methyltransferase
MDYIDINLGPAQKGGSELMEWVVKTVQEVVDTPFYLDTVNAEAIEAGLKIYKNKKGKAVINSIMARPESMEVKFPLAQKYDAGVVGLLWGPSGLPRDAERSPCCGVDAKSHGVWHPGRGYLDGSDRYPGD